MGRAESLLEKINKWMEVLYENLPDDVAIFCYIRIRDKNIENRIEWNEDWETIANILHKNCTSFDKYAIKQDIDEIRINW